jgi:hypothetical protein
MTDHHDTQCPVMEIGCHSVGGYSVHHNRGRAGDCRCGKKCECALIVRVRAEEREKKMAAADTAFLDAVAARERLEQVRDRVQTMLDDAKKQRDTLDNDYDNDDVDARDDPHRYGEKMYYSGRVIGIAEVLFNVIDEATHDPR